MAVRTDRCHAVNDSQMATDALTDRCDAMNDSHVNHVRPPCISLEKNQNFVTSTVRSCQRDCCSLFASERKAMLQSRCWSLTRKSQSGPTCDCCHRQVLQKKKDYTTKWHCRYPVGLKQHTCKISATSREAVYFKERLQKEKKEAKKKKEEEKEKEGKENTTKRYCRC